MLRDIALGHIQAVGAGLLIDALFRRNFGQQVKLPLAETPMAQVLIHLGQ